jgi:hypothetical protein
LDVGFFIMGRQTGPDSATVCLPIDIPWLLFCISNADEAFLEILTPSPWREKQFMAAANPGLGPHG